MEETTADVPQSDEVTIIKDGTSKEETKSMKERNYTLENGKWKCKNCKKLLSKNSSHYTLAYHLKTHKAASSRTLEQYSGFKRNEDNKEKLTVDFIVQGSHAFSIVDEDGFRNLIKYYQSHPTQDVPTRNTVKKWIFDDFQKGQEKVKQILVTVAKIALTTDMWTSSSNKPFMVVTGHFIKDDELIDLILDFSELSYPHTGQRIFERLSEVVHAFDIQHKIAAVTTDNAASNVSAFKDKAFFGAIHVRCFPHCLNVAVREGLKLVKEELKQVRNLSIQLKKPKQVQKLEKLCRTLEVDFLQPLSDVKTRWNSTHAMLKRIVELKPAIINLLERDLDFRCYDIQEDQWMLFGELIDVLTPYSEATKTMSGTKYVTMSLVYPVISRLCKKRDEVRVLMEGKAKEVSEAIKEKFDSFIPFLKNDIACLATLLDPRSNISFFPENERQALKDNLQKLFEAYEQQRPSVEIESIYCDLFNEDAVTNEVSTYLGQARANMKMNPMEYWKSHKDAYPDLSRLALDVLLIPGSSVSSEQAFSKAAEVITKRRNRLKNVSVQAVMCLDSWKVLSESKKRKNA